MSEGSWVLLQEALKIAGNMKPGTFSYHVRAGHVKTRDGIGTRDHEYFVPDIVKLKSRSRKKEQAQEEDKPEIVDWSGTLDAAAGLRLSQQLYGEHVDIAELAVYQSWRKNNSQLTLCVFSHDRRDCFAELQVLPLAEPLILDILAGKRKESSIQPDEIRSYNDPGPYYLIVTNAVTLPGRPELLTRLLIRYMDFWTEQYPEKYIKRIYTQAVSERGFMLVQHFFMTPRFDLAPDAYMIDLAYPSASKIIQRFKQRLEAKAPLIEDLILPGWSNTTPSQHS